MKNYIIVPIENLPECIKSLSAKQPFSCIINAIPQNEGITIGLSLTSDFSAENIPEDVKTTIIESQHKGGTIISFKDNITLFEFSEHNVDYKPLICSYLKEKGINCSIDNNDILCDGFKVAGDMLRNINKTTYLYAIHISINVDINLINKICTKPMDKLPRGLSFYGIKREDILSYLKVPDAL